jgi:glutamyl-tRNA reductase
VSAETGTLSGIRLGHDVADLDAIAAARAPDAEALVRELVAETPAREAFVLQTCHRVEAYVVTERRDAGPEALAPRFGGDAAVQMGHEESLRHLLRVGAGLESLVLGEDQILGQLRDAFETARRAGGVGPVLETAVTKAIHVGERARSETAINEGVVSLGSAAVELAETELAADLRTATALVVGAGEMGTLAARALADAGVTDLAVANRTPERAERVAADLDAPAETVDLEALPALVPAADLVVAATGSDEPVLTRDALEAARGALVVDLGQPRDVAPAAARIDGVDLRDIEDLEAVTARTHERRADAADRVEAMVDREYDRLVEQCKRQRADEAIAAMYEAAERMKAREVAETLDKLEARGDLADGQREAVEALADALISQLLAAPTKSLRDAAAEDDWATIATALELFDPGFEDGSVDAADADADRRANADTDPRSGADAAVDATGNED